EALFARGYAHVFDVPDRSGRAIERLEMAAYRAADADALKERIGQLSEVRKKWIEEMTAFMNTAGDPTSRKFIAASLGDAESAVQLFSEPPYSEIPEYRNRLQEAKAKAESEQRHAAK